MAITASYTLNLALSGDQVLNLAFVSAANAGSPFQEQLITTINGANTLTAPLGGSTPVGLIIIPPAANAITMILKGVTGDTGVPLHLTNPFITSLATTFVSCVITTNAIMTGLRIIWV